MRIVGINHIGLAPKDPVKAKWFFETVLGVSNLGEELVAEQRTLTSFFASSTSKTPSSNPRLEILENQPNTEGPIAKFLASRGAGLHHLALGVESIEAALAHLKKFNIQMIDAAPRSGAHNTRIAFIHPQATGGLLIELVEQK